MSTHITDNLQPVTRNSEDSCLLYFFCSHADDKRNTEVAIIRGLMWQLIMQWGDLIKSLLRDFQLYKDNQGLFSAENKEVLWKNFEMMLSDIDTSKTNRATVYCVIDGLDEIKSQSIDWLPRKLRNLCLTLKSDIVVHIAVTSRDFPDSIKGALEDVDEILIDPDHNVSVQIDLDSFISESVDALARTKKYDSALKETVHRGLSEGADGTFLWVSYAVKELQKTPPSETSATLSRQPKGLNGIYERMLLEIDDSKRQEVVEMLRWLVAAERPLRLSELKAGLVSRIRGTNTTSNIEERVGFAGSILKVVDSTDPSVQFFHRTAKTFLLNLDSTSNPGLHEFEMKEPEINFEVAKRCFEYIQRGSLSDGPIDLLDQELGSPSSVRRRQYPLVEYAAKYWPSHARKASPEIGNIFDAWPNFSIPQSRIRKTWLTTYWSWDSRKSTLPRDFSMMDLAAFFGITPLLSKLIASRSLNSLELLPKSIRRKRHDDMTPLHWACRNGHKTAVKLLLEKYSINEKGYGLSPLTWAVRNGHDGVVKILLQAGASVEVRDYGMTPLNWAAWEGKKDVAQLLISHSAEIDATTAQGTKQQSWLVDSRASNGEFPWATAIEAADIFRAAEMDLEMRIARESTAFNICTSLCSLNIFCVAFLLASVIISLRERTTNWIWLSNRTGKLRGQSVCWASFTIYGKFRLAYDLVKDRKYATAAIVQACTSFPMAIYFFTGSFVLLWTYASWQSHFMAMVVYYPLAIAISAPAAILTTLANRWVNTVLTTLVVVVNWVYLRTRSVTVVFEATSALVSTMVIICRTLGYKWALDYEWYIYLSADSVASIGSAVWVQMGRISHGYTSLILSASRGHEHIVSLLLQNGANTNAKDSTGRSAEQIALQYGYMAVVHTFLVHEADAVERYRDGSSSLQLAASLNRLDLVKELRRRGADLNRRSDDGWTALHCAATYGLLDMVRILCSEAQNDTLSAKDNRGWTPLHVASRNSSAEVCKYLIDMGADINDATSEGFTPLMLACCAKSLDKVKLLLARRSDIGLRAERGLTALHHAAEYGKLAIVVALLEGGACVDATTDLGETSLHYACYFGHPDVVDHLLKHGADINKYTNFGYQVMHYAASGGFVEVAQRLVTGGALLNHDRQIKVSPLTSAIRNDKEDILVYFLQAGMDPNLVDMFGRTAFDYAALKPELYKVVSQYAYHSPISDQERLNIRKETLQRVGRAVLEVPIEKRDFGDLAFDLMVMRRFEDSRLAFSWSGLSRTFRCASCSVVVADVGLKGHVCLECHDVHLCNGCMAEYEKGLIFPQGCRGHQYLTFNATNWAQRISEDRDSVIRTQDDWLKGLLESESEDNLGANVES